MDLTKIEQALLDLNYRVASRALRAWSGELTGSSELDIYNGLRSFLDPGLILSVRRAAGSSGENRRIFHTLLGHYVQFRAAPFDNELSMWMRGASADVEGEKINIKDVHAWCQKHSTRAKRRIMEKETSSLSKFLRQFALSSWEFVLGLLSEEFDYPSYIAYCQEKKGIDYGAWASRLEEILDLTHDLYFGAMEDWTRRTLGEPLSALNRLDGIYLVGLGQFDDLFPNHVPLAEHLQFFRNWGIDLANQPGLYTNIAYSSKKGAQGITFALRIPGEVHVVMNPYGGWIDLETLFHEMGHALHHLFTSPELPPVEKDFYTSPALSESFAFFVQNQCFSPVFLERQLGLTPEAIETIGHYKALKDLAFFRRYAAKFLAEYRMFQSGDIANGTIYSDLLTRTTGFAYRPESHIFDLVPELYSLDYVMSWMAEVTLRRSVENKLGEEWMFRPEAGEILKTWWATGNRYEIEEHLEKNNLGPLSPQDLLERWSRHIRGGMVH